MPVRIERLEVTRPDHADSALRHAKVTEAGLPEQWPARAQIAAFQNRVRVSDDPQLLRGHHVALPVGSAACQPNVPDAECPGGHSAEPPQSRRVTPCRLGQPGADRAHQSGRRGRLQFEGPLQQSGDLDDEPTTGPPSRQRYRIAPRPWAWLS